jgi:hypothetical protein
LVQKCNGTVLLCRARLFGSRFGMPIQMSPSGYEPVTALSCCWIWTVWIIIVSNLPWRTFRINSADRTGNMSRDVISCYCTRTLLSISPALISCNPVQYRKYRKIIRLRLTDHMQCPQECVTYGKPWQLYIRSLVHKWLYISCYTFMYCCRKRIILLFCIALQYH